MTTQLYYTAPSDEIFNDCKEQAMKLWHIVDTDNDRYGYATEKVDQIKDVANVRDNFMYIVAMFDYGNQRQLALMVKPETLEAINERIIDGGGMPILL